MHKWAQNAIKWVSLLAVLLTLQPQCVQAAQLSIDKIESISAEKFIEAKNLKDLRGQSLADAFKNDENTVPCGTVANKCNIKTHVCYRCWSRRKVLGGSFYESNNEKGFCVTKQNHKDQANKECPAEDNWFTGWTQRNYIEKNGFIQKSEARGFGLLTLANNDKERLFYENGKASNNAYILAINSDENSIQYATPDKSVSNATSKKNNITKGCEVLPVKIYNMSGCFFCPLAAVVFNTANDVAGLSLQFFGAAFQQLITAGFAVWLAFTTLSIVFTYTKQDANKYLSGIIKQAGKFMIAYLLLSSPQDLFDLFIVPVLDTGLNMGDGIKALSNVKPDNYTPSVLNNSQFFNSGNLYGKIEIFLAGVQKQLSAIQAIGTSLFCVGGQNLLRGGDGLILRTDLGGGLQMMFLGLILFVIALLLSLSFAFYFMDSLLQLSILGAMMPLMIAGFPFKPTINYSITGLKMLLNTFFMMFFTGFVISVEILLLDSAIEEMNSASGAGADGKATGLGGLFEAINTQDTKRIQELTDIGLIGFAVILFSALFGFKFVKEVPALANSMAPGLKMGISSRVGTMMASTAKGAATKAGKPFAKAASRHWHNAGGLGGLVGGAMMVPGAGAKRLVNAINNRYHKKGKVTKLDRMRDAYSKRVGKLSALSANLKGRKNVFAKAAGAMVGGVARAMDAVKEKGGIIAAGGSWLRNFSKRVHKGYQEYEDSSAYLRKQREVREKKSGSGDSE